MFDLLGFEDNLLVTLEDGVRQANERFVADEVIANVDRIVKQRTQRGEYLDGSSPDPGTYRSSSHKKAREKRGLQIDRVDLFFGESDMLEGTGGRTSSDGDSLVIEYGYLEGIASAEQLELASYHNTEGAGRGRVIRRHVGLTGEEAGDVLDQIGRGYGSTLDDVLG